MVAISCQLSLGLVSLRPSGVGLDSQRKLTGTKPARLESAIKKINQDQMKVSRIIFKNFIDGLRKAFEVFSILSPNHSAGRTSPASGNSLRRISNFQFPINSPHMIPNRMNADIHFLGNLFVSTSPRDIVQNLALPR